MAQPMKIGNQIILSYEDQDEPTQEDIEEYAKWLGIDPNKDYDLMWIAVEGVSAPLPENWKSIQSDAGELYFFNFATGESRWDHPLDQFYKDLAQKELKEKKERAETRNTTSSASLKSKKRSKSKSTNSKKQSRASSQTKLQPISQKNLQSINSENNNVDEEHCENQSRQDRVKGIQDLNRSDTMLVLGNIDKPKSTAHLFPSSSEDDVTSVSSGYGCGTSDLDEDGRSNPMAKERLQENSKPKHLIRSEIDTLRMEADELKENIETLKHNRTQIENETNQMRIQKDNLLSEYQLLQQNYQELQARTSEEHERQAIELEKLSRQTKDLEDRVKLLHTQKCSIEDSILASRTEKERANNDLVELEKEIEKRRCEKDKLFLETEHWNAQLRTMSMKVEEEELRLTSLKHENNILIEKIAQIQEEEYLLQRSSQEALQSKARLGIRLFNQIKALKEDRDAIRRQLSNLQSVTSSELNSLVNNIVAYISREMKELQNALGRDKDILQQKSVQENNLLASKNKEMQKQIRELKENEHKLIKRNQQLEDNIQTLNEQLRETTISNQNVSKTMSNVKIQTEGGTDLQESHNEIQRLQNLIDNMKRRYESELSQEREKLKKIIEDIRSKHPDEDDTLKVSFNDNSIEMNHERHRNTVDQKEVVKKYEEWKRKCFESIDRETKSLEKAKQFVKHERKKIKHQQEVLQQARDEWKHDMAMLTNHSANNNEKTNLTAMIFSNSSSKNGDFDASGAPKMAKILRAVKKILEKQALRLNSEVKQLNRIQQWIKLREEKLSLLKQTVEKSTPLSSTQSGQHKLFYKRLTKSSPSPTGIDSPESFQSFDWESFSDSTEGSLGNTPTSLGFQEGLEHESSSIYQKLKKIEEEIRFIHDKIENHFNTSTSSNSPYYVDPSSYQSISDQYLSDKWENYFSKYNKGISLKVLLRKDKLIDFQDQLLQWERDRGVEIQALNEHMRWMKRLHNEMGKRLSFK